MKISTYGRGLSLFILTFCFSFSLFAQESGAKNQRSSVYGDHYKSTSPLTAKPKALNQVPGKGNFSMMTPPAGCDTVFFQTFPNGIVPAGWRNLDVDMAAGVQGRPGNWFPRVIGMTTPTDSNYAMVSNSWFSAIGVANNWLITDTFTVCDPNLYLVFLSASFEGPVYLDGFKVKVSTTDSNTTSFTTTLGTFAEGIGTTANLTAGIVPPFPGLFWEYKFPLAAYNGQRIRIAIHHDSDDDNLLYIDNVSVHKPNAYDALLWEADDNSEYRFVPELQAQPRAFVANVYNNGTDTLNSVTITATVDAGGSPLYTGTGSISNLLSGNPGEFRNATTSTSYQAAGPGTYFVNIGLSTTPTDLQTDNNDASYEYYITDSVYARDDDVSEGSLSLSDTEDGYLGQTYEFFAADTITSVTFFLDGPTAGDSVYAVVMAMSGGAPNQGQILGTSYKMEIVDPGPNFYTLGLMNSVPVAAGMKYFVGLKESVSGLLTVGTSPSKYTPGEGWAYFQGAWSNIETAGFDVALMIRANTGTAQFVSRDKENMPLTNVAIFPVPASEELSVLFDFQEATEVTATLYDILGKELATKHVENSRKETLTFDVRNLKAGNYLIKVQTPNSVMNRKVSISR